MKTAIPRRASVAVRSSKRPATVLTEIGMPDHAISKKQRDILQMIERCIEISSAEVKKPEFEWSPAGTLYANAQ